MRPTPPPPKPLRWVRYECSGVLLKLGLLSPEAELAHRRFCDYHWETGLWPSSPDFACALGRARLKRWPATLKQLRALGWRPARRQLTNPTVAAVRRAALAFVRQRKASARVAAEARWSNPQSPTAEHAEHAESHRPLPRMPRFPTSPHPSPMRHASVTQSVTQCVRNASAMPIKINIKDKHIKSSTSEKRSLTHLNAERLMLSASPPSSEGSAEQKFLGNVMEVMATWSPKEGSAELTNWGGWWRNRFRQDPGKARRILAEIASMIREHRIIASPGAAAGDLWKRLP